MKKITWKNRITALLLAVFMTIGILPAQVYAADGEEAADLGVLSSLSSEGSVSAPDIAGEQVTLVEQSIRAHIISVRGEAVEVKAGPQPEAEKSEPEAEAVMTEAPVDEAENTEPAAELVEEKIEEPAEEKIAEPELAVKSEPAVTRELSPKKSVEIKSTDTKSVESFDKADAAAAEPELGSGSSPDTADAEPAGETLEISDPAPAKAAAPAKSSAEEPAEQKSEEPAAAEPEAQKNADPEDQSSEAPADNNAEEPESTEPQEQPSDTSANTEPADTSANTEPADNSEQSADAEAPAEQPAEQPSEEPVTQPAAAEAPAEPEVTLSGKLPAEGIVTARPVEPEIADLSPIAAFDIKVYANSEKLASDSPWQPQEPIQVRIQSDALAGRTDALDIYHIPDGSTTPEYVTTVQAADSAVEFSAASFSVYVVVDHEETGTVVTPRVVFHFIASGATEHGSGSTAYYEGTPYEFKNKGVENSSTDPVTYYTQTTQILKNGESLELITDPTNQGTKLFYGWYVVDPKVISGTTDDYGIGTSDGKLYYSWPTAPDSIAFESAISITESNVSIGYTVLWTLKVVSGAGAVEAEGNVHVFLAPLFENYNFVNFMLHPKGGDGTVMTRKLIAKGSSENVEVKISDIRSTSTDPVHLIFTGWEYNAGTELNPDWQEIQTVDYTGAEIKASGRDGTYLTVDLSDTTSIDLYPVFIEARWVDFFSGVSGGGASYVASRFRESWGTPENPPAGMTENNERNVFTTLDTSARTGYDFEGWYAFAKTDEHTGEITNLSTPADVEISYITGSNDNYATHTVTVNTTAIRISNSGSIDYSGTLYLTDNGNDTGTIGSSGDYALFGEGSSAGVLKFYNALDMWIYCACKSER